MISRAFINVEEGKDNHADQADKVSVALCPPKFFNLDGFGDSTTLVASSDKTLTTKD
jgi:hypothetical protein